MSEEEPRGNQLVKEPLQIKNGHILVPDKPGIGVELDETALPRFPKITRNLSTRLRYDGSVIDQ